MRTFATPDWRQRRRFYLGRRSYPRRCRQLWRGNRSRRDAGFSLGQSDRRLHGTMPLAQRFDVLGNALPEHTLFFAEAALAPRQRRQFRDRVRGPAFHGRVRYRRRWRRWGFSGTTSILGRASGSGTGFAMAAWAVEGCVARAACGGTGASGGFAPVFRSFG